MPLGDIISYRDAMKLFNEGNFGSSLWGIPRKGFAGYNMVQRIRKGEPYENFSTLAQLQKKEDPITVPTKKQQEKAKAEEDAKKKKKVIKLKKPNEEEKIKAQNQKLIEEERERIKKREEMKRELREKWGSGADKKDPSKLFEELANRGITTNWNYENIRGDLPSMTDLDLAFPYFYSKYKDYLEAKAKKDLEEGDEDLNKASTSVKINFGSTVQEQVNKIKEILSSSWFRDGGGNVDQQKQAVRKALEILKYKENHIIQEARKPLQRELFILLQSIKTKPKYKINFPPSPTGGNTGSRQIDNTELSKEIPVFEKSVVEMVEEEVKKEEKQQKKVLKEMQEKSKKEQEDQDKKDKEYASTVDKESIKDKWGTGMDKKYPSDNLFFTMAERGITDPLNYDKNKGDLPPYKDFFATFGNTFFSKYDDYLQDFYEGDKKLRKLREEQDADNVYDKDGRLLYTKSALAKLEDEIKEAEKKAKDYLKEKLEIESTKTTKTLQRWGGGFTKKESEEFDEIDKLIAGKRILKTDPIAKEYTKKMKELETRALKGVQERSAKLRKLRQDLDDLVEKKLLMTGAVKAEDKEPSGKMFSIEDSMDLLNRFSRKGSAKQDEVKKMAENVSKAVDINPDEDWRAKMGYNDTVWEKSGSQYIVRNEFNRNSQLPKEYTKEQGYRWLEEKYGDLYKTAIEKTKMLGGENRVSMTEKQLKEARRLEFKDGNQMKEFFRDVLLADPIIYSMLNINAHKTKAPATTNALREFKKWVGS